MRVYLLYQGDGTAIQAGPKLVGATLNAEKAEEWHDALPEGSWDYRRIMAVPLGWNQQEES